ncbi:hypothetical protein C1646_667324 [Rhizophagus diaphanus]|nr:hypothetical protein C1646_667324 [Rhizophagus diaphanus] [Rhizophagus sp. MUCL 43196]
MLNLWKVDIPGDTNDVKMKTLQSRIRYMYIENIIIKELGGIELTPFDDVGDIFECSSKNIRIIVQPPATTTDQGLDQEIADYITQFGYLPRLSGLGGTLLPLGVKVGSTNEGVNLSGRDRELICLRIDIIKSLINELKYKKGSHINWDTFGKKWKSIVGISWEEWTEQCRKIPSILIVDEAHLIYGKDKEVSNKESADKSADQFWATVKSLLQEVSSINIIMFVPYGYRSSNCSGLMTPVILPEKNCKSLINFSQGELKTYVKNYCNKCFKILNQQDVIELYEYIHKIFTAMCNDLSGNILREMLGFGSDGRILEQTWQKEFYRIGTQVLGKYHFLSYEVGSVFGCEGKIDFYVDKLDWAIELLRDGEDMAKHKRRFEPGGEYKEIVKYAKSITIIDICSIGRVDTRNEAKKVQEMKADFIYVSSSKDFDAFKIESLGKEPVIIRFQN